MNIPTKEKCYELFAKYKTPKNIISHLEGANKVAVFLAKKLKEAGVDIDVELVDAASLLHDIIREVPNHAEASADALEKEGFKEVAGVVRVHNSDKIVMGVVRTWEQKVVYYADKRFIQSIDSLQDRIDYWKTKYSKYKNKIEKGAPKMFELEKGIFNKLGIKPGQLKELVK